MEIFGNTQFRSEFSKDDADILCRICIYEYVIKLEGNLGFLWPESHGSDTDLREEPGEHLFPSQLCCLFVHPGIAYGRVVFHGKASAIFKAEWLPFLTGYYKAGQENQD